MWSARTFIREAGDRFFLYLPLLCMVVLALGTYWMVRTTPVAETPRAPSAPRHAPDYFMQGFAVKTFDAAGRLRSEVMGDKVRHYPDNQWLEIDGIRIRSFDTKGHLTTASANRGLTNQDSSEVQLMGNAVIVREPSKEAGQQGSPRVQYRSEFWHAFMDTERLKSHLPVELLRGKDRFTADRMDYDNVEQTVELTGRVRATLMPTPQR